MAQKLYCRRKKIKGMNNRNINHRFYHNVTFLINQIERDDGKEKQRLACATA